MMEQPLLVKFEEMTRLVRSPEWRQYVAFLDARHRTLQEGVNAAVKTGDLVQAQIKLALMADCTKQVELFRERMRELEKTLRQEEKA